MEALEFDAAMQNLRQAVYNDLKIPEHPIEVNQFNICKLMQEGKLKTLKLQDLKAISTTIGLTTEGSQARKKSFVEPLKELVEKCTSKGSSDVYEEPRLTNRASRNCRQPNILTGSIYGSARTFFLYMRIRFY